MDEPYVEESGAAGEQQEKTENAAEEQGGSPEPEGIEPTPELEKVDETVTVELEEPEKSPTEPEQSADKKKKSKNSIQLKLVLLDGKDLDLEGSRKSVTEAVVDPGHTETQTLETDFFSAYFYDNYETKNKDQPHKLKQKIFLIPRRQLRSQLSAQERESFAQPWTYCFGVKFYVPDPNNSKILKDDHSRFLYCLQLCEDIRANRIHVDRETAIRLTALMLQGKLGDYEQETHQSGYHQQFPQFQLLPDALKPDNYEAQIIEVHKAKAGYTPAQADAEFLSIAKDLSRYGEHLFLARTMRNDNHDDCRIVTIGNGCKGISFYYEEKEEKDKTHISWKDIVKISYKKDKFRIIYRPPVGEIPDEETSGKRPKIKVKFYTGPRPQAKRLWKNAVEQHVFFHLESTKTPNIVSSFLFRSSMRYSFKKTLPSAKKHPEPVEDKKDRQREVIPRDLPAKDEDDEWVILQYPPLYDPEASKQQEHQKVQVDFKPPEEEDSPQGFVIRRDQIGSLELIDCLKPEDGKRKDRSYSLSLVDEDSKAATVTVSLKIDPPSEVTLSTGGSDAKGVPVFDSERMPVVNVGSASVVTTATVIEQDGKKLSTGERSQKYPLEEVTGVEETDDKLAGPPGGDATEAEQVHQFLEQELQMFQKVQDDAPPDMDGD